MTEHLLLPGLKKTGDLYEVQKQLGTFCDLKRKDQLNLVWPQYFVKTMRIYMTAFVGLVHHYCQLATRLLWSLPKEERGRPQYHSILC